MEEKTKNATKYLDVFFVWGESDMIQVVILKFSKMLGPNLISEMKSIKLFCWWYSLAYVVYWRDLDVSKNEGGKPPKMDGLENGKALLKWMIWG